MVLFRPALTPSPEARVRTTSTMQKTVQVIQSTGTVATTDSDWHMTFTAVALRSTSEASNHAWQA